MPNEKPANSKSTILVGMRVLPASELSTSIVLKNRASLKGCGTCRYCMTGREPVTLIGAVVIVNIRNRMKEILQVLPKVKNAVARVRPGEVIDVYPD